MTESEREAIIEICKRIAEKHHVAMRTGMANENPLMPIDAMHDQYEVIEFSATHGDRRYETVYRLAMMHRDPSIIDRVDMMLGTWVKP